MEFRLVMENEHDFRSLRCKPVVSPREQFRRLVADNQSMGWGWDMIALVLFKDGSEEGNTLTQWSREDDEAESEGTFIVVSAAINAQRNDVPRKVCSTVAAAEEVAVRVASRCNSKHPGFYVCKVIKRTFRDEAPIKVVDVE